MSDASEERERAIELRFWQTVDRNGLTGLPSDMWAALEQLTQDRAALATARREGMEKAAKWHEMRSGELRGKVGLARNFRQLLRQSDFHMESAAAIRAAAKEGEP